MHTFLMIEIGISGWTYEGWRGTFYPPKLPHNKELAFASRKVSSIEINGTFYSLQRPASYEKWYESTPQDFIFSVKANRYITHVRKLNDPEIPMANFFASGVLNLKEKLGPFLWQFPPNMGFHPERWEKFLSLLPRDFKEAAKLAKKNVLAKERTSFRFKENHPIRHAVEVRHMSFLDPLFVEMLKEHNVAIVFADTAGKWPYLEDVTSDFIYIRLHGDEELYVSGYDDPALDFWSERIAAWKNGREPEDAMTITDEKPGRKKRDIFVYFDNDAKVRAPIDAQSLIKKVCGPELAH
ncbi:MAG: DUF72 domain-containing protein [Bdellovibrionota bacterium]